jgi:hypothetical protein
VYHRYEIGDLVSLKYGCPGTGIIMDKIESKRIVDPRIPKQTITSAGYKVLINGEMQNIIESEIVKKIS